MLYYLKFSVSSHSNPLVIILAKYFPHHSIILEKVLGHSLLRNYLTSEPGYKVIVSLPCPCLLVLCRVTSPFAQCCTNTSSLRPHETRGWKTTFFPPPPVIFQLNQFFNLIYSGAVNVPALGRRELVGEREAQNVQEHWAVQLIHAALPLNHVLT